MEPLNLQRLAEAAYRTEKDRAIAEEMQRRQKQAEAERLRLANERLRIAELLQELKPGPWPQVTENPCLMGELLIGVASAEAECLQLLRRCADCGHEWFVGSFGTLERLGELLARDETACGCDDQLAEDAAHSFRDISGECGDLLVGAAAR